MLLIIFWIIIFLLSLFFLVKSSDYFISYAEKIGSHFGLPSFIIGLLIVSVGTSLPELITSIIAVLNNSSEIVIGTVVGSNIANILLILGITVLYVGEMKVTKRLYSEVLFLIGSITLLIICSFNGSIGIIETILLLALFIYFIIYTIRKKNYSKTIKRPDIKLYKTIFLLLISMGVIYLSAEYLIKSVIKLSDLFGVGKEIIAVLFIAIGTSLPELTVSIRAAMHKKPDIAIGNIIGSNIFNILGIIGISSLFGAIIIPSTIFIGIMVLVIATILFILFIQDRKISFAEGITFIIFYAIFVAYVVFILI